MVVCDVVVVTVEEPDPVRETDSDVETIELTLPEVEADAVIDADDE